MAKKIAKIERRHERSGFAYTDNTRMMFAPKFTVTRDDADKLLNDIVICAARGHPDPTKADIEATINALVAMYPNDVIYVDTLEGLTTVNNPK